MTKTRDIDDVLELLGYKDYKIRQAMLDIFHILDSHEFDNETKKGLFQVGIELVDQKEASRVPDDPNWVAFKNGEHRPGMVARVRDDVYTGKAAWHRGKVGEIVAIRSGRVIVKYIGRSDGLGHYHAPDMIEVLED